MTFSVLSEKDDQSGIVPVWTMFLFTEALIFFVLGYFHIVYTDNTIEYQYMYVILSQPFYFSVLHA